MMSTNPKTRSGGLVCCLLLPLSLSAYADPSIQSVQSEGNTVIITGDQFGTHDLEVAVTDTIDNRMATEGGSTDYSVDYQGFWDQLGSNWADPLTAESKTGPLGLEGNNIYSGVEKTYNGWPSITGDKTNRSFYVSWWYKPSMSPADSGGSNKFIRIWDEKDGNHTRISWTQMHLTHSADDIGSSGKSWSGWGGEVGQWNLMEIYVDSDDGSIQTWVNGDQTHNVTDFKKSTTTQGLRIGIVGFDPSISSNYPGIETNIDDIYFSSSRARVVVSEHDAWSEAKKDHFAMLPVSWADNEVKAALTDKITENVKNYFFYVIDELGNVNTNGVSVCSECPAPLESLSVE